MLPTEQPFANKIVLVTGSARGIGRAIALHFARLGADLVINFQRHRSAAEQTCAEIRATGREALPVKADVGSDEGLESLFSETEARFGGLDILVHNAATGFNRPALEQKPKAWNWTFDVNARALLFAAQRAVPLMEKRGGGAIISISSPGAQWVLPDYALVGASKAALEALTRYLAVELAPRNIAVNAVSPGMVETDALKYFEASRASGIIARVAERTPAGRLVTPEDVAGVVAFLCSPAAAMIRGQIILLDGGYTLKMQQG